MVIVRLMGGLGNQMFQYATGKSLATYLNTELKLDTGFYRNRHDNPEITPREFDLSLFNINCTIASESEITNLKKGNPGLFGKIIKKSRSFFLPYYKQPIFKRRYNHFDHNIFKVHRSVYIDGYWQSYKYFRSIEEIIKNQFVLKHDPDEINRQSIDLIRKTNSLCLHIRRGDYIMNPLINKKYIECSFSYYKKAIKFISERVRDLHLFFFSDDMQWVKENFNTEPFPVTYMKHNPPENGYEDIRLMSNCKYFIITNSTFSWWGAWLSQFPDKIVIAPKRWYRDINMENKDIYPPDWIIMEN